MNVHALIVTHEPDFTWLDYALKCWKRYATGFGGITVVFPAEGPNFWGGPYGNVTFRSFKEAPQRGHLHHQVVKLRADELVPPGTDSVLFLDADCMVKEPINPGHYLNDGKPVNLTRTYDSIRDSDCYQWKAVAETNLGFPITDYTMCRHPAHYPVSVFKPYREHIERTHDQSFEKYVLSQKFTRPCGFCEWPTIGPFVRQFMPEVVSWIDISKDLEPRFYTKDRMKAFYSHAGLDQYIGPGWHDGRAATPEAKKEQTARQLIEWFLTRPIGPLCPSCGSELTTSGDTTSCDCGVSG